MMITKLQINTDSAAAARALRKAGYYKAQWHVVGYVRPMLKRWHFTGDTKPCDATKPAGLDWLQRWARNTLCEVCRCSPKGVWPAEVHDTGVSQCSLYLEDGTPIIGLAYCVRHRDLEFNNASAFSTWFGFGRGALAAAKAYAKSLILEDKTRAATVEIAARTPWTGGWVTAIVLGQWRLRGSVLRKVEKDDCADGRAERID